MGRYKTYKVRGKRTETQLTQKYVTFVLILIVDKGSGRYRCWLFFII